MKIACTADAHLRTRAEYPERYGALENILEQMKKERIDTLFILGDLFDREFQNYSDFEKLCRQNNEMTVHIIPGNHDAGISEQSIVGDNIRVYTEPATLELDAITFLFIPYRKGVQMGEVIAGVENDIAGKDWVLLSHGDYYGGVKEQNPLEPGTYMPLSRGDVGRFRPLAVMLGHIHKPHHLAKVHYCGSPCGLDISETGRRRFLIYDTSNREVLSRHVRTDILFFDETFIVVPAGNETSLLQEQIEKRIGSWALGPDDSSKIVVRVEAKGYCMDRQALLNILKRGFGSYKYYDGEGPVIEHLSVSSDHQLNAVAERSMQYIDNLEWKCTAREPGRDKIKYEALEVIYRK